MQIQMNMFENNPNIDYVDLYLKWNDAIAEHFFNEEMSGKSVYLYITKDEIIDIGEKIIEDAENRNSIWENYCLTINNALSGNDLLDKLLYSFAINNAERKQRFYPLYLGCLVLSVIPLTSFEGKYSTANYYDAVNDFLKSNNLTVIPRQNSSNNWNKIWKDLEDWSINGWNGELGVFKMMTLHHEYVGKPLSQCLISRKQLKKLPQFYDSCNLLPNEIISNKTIRDLLLRNRPNILEFKNSIYEIIKTNDELGKTIIEIIRNEYLKWNGEIHIYDNNNVAIQNHYTLSPIKLCMRLDNEMENVSFYYRLSSQNTFPIDLRFGDYDCMEQQKGWSKPLKFEKCFYNSFEFVDKQNKWKTRYNFDKIKLLIDGYSSPDKLEDKVECKKLNFYSDMYLIVESKSVEEIIKWSSTFNQGDFEEIKYFNEIYPDYYLYKFRNPTASCKYFDLLTLYDDKLEIVLEGGLNCGRRSFLSCILPEIIINNSKGVEKVFLKYEDDEKEIELIKAKGNNNIWLLPSNIDTGREFSIFIKNVDLDSYKLKYKIINPGMESPEVTQNRIPTRDSTGNLVLNEDNLYIKGNIIEGNRDRLIRLCTKIEAEIHNYISNE